MKFLRDDLPLTQWSSVGRGAWSVARGVVLLFLLHAPISRLHAQRPVWVLLKPEAVASGKIVRGANERAARPNDRAIPRNILKQIEKTGAKIRYTSRWLQAVSVDADAAAIDKIKRLKQVQALREVGTVKAASSAHGAPDPTLHAPRPTPHADFDSVFYGPNWKAIKQLGIAPAHQLGFTGKSIRIAILDTGFEPAHNALSSRFVAAQRDFIKGDNIVADEAGDDQARQQEQHGTWVWSILGGFKPGSIVGPAYDSRFLLAKVDLNETTDTIDVAADEDRWVAAVEWADSLGADIISSSLVYKQFSNKPSYTTSDFNGDVSLAAIEADEAARRGILVVNAIGDQGPELSSLWTPADADSIISVGAVDSTGNPATFSGRGPTADGRVKPELVALGRNLVGAHAADLTSYDFIDGTSVSTALIAGGAAMFMQAWPNLTIMAVRNALLLSGSRAQQPDNNVGWGVPNIASAILFPEGFNAIVSAGLNLEGDLTTIQPTFSWIVPLINQQMLPVKYRLEIATDPVFNTVIYSDTISNVTTLTLKRPLRPSPAYWYRVVATTLSGVTRISPATPPITMPDWVSLLTLNSATGTITDSVRPVLRWEPLLAPAPSGPFTYEVQVTNAQTGAIVVRMTNVTTSSIQPPDPLAPNVSYKWRVIARSPLGVADTVESRGPFVVVSDKAPPTTTLYQNFPNPFPRTDLGETVTHIWFDVTTPAAVDLAVYDLHGRLIKRLIPNSPTCTTVVLPPGAYGRSTPVDPCVSTTWDGTDARGNRVPRGIYLLRMRAGGTDSVKKILYLPD